MTKRRPRNASTALSTGSVRGDIVVNVFGVMAQEPRKAKTPKASEAGPLAWANLVGWNLENTQAHIAQMRKPRVAAMLAWVNLVY